MMSLRLHLWKDRAQVVEELKEVPQEDFIKTLMDISSYNPSVQQAIHRLLCKGETEVHLLYEKSFTEVRQEEYSWKNPERFEGRVNDLIINWKYLWSVSKQKLELIIDFYSKSGRILERGGEGSFLYMVDDFVLEEIQEMQKNNRVDEALLLKLCSILQENCNSHGQSHTLVEKIKALIADVEEK